MSQITTNLALTLWNSLTDPYDSSELVDNFVKIDLHDHATAGGVKIPFAGIATAAIASSSDTSSSKFVVASDTRLSDGRPPDFNDINWSTNADYTIVATKSSIIRQTATLTAARTVTLPAANALAAGTEIIIQAGSNVDASKTISINKSGSDTINEGTAAVVIGVAYAFRRFITDGVSAWVYDAGVLRTSNNLSELTATASTARTNLGLGSFATLNAVPDASITGGTAGTGVKIAATTITNANIATSAGIVDTKLATISTAGKVSNSALAGNGAITIGSTELALGDSADIIEGVSALYTSAVLLGANAVTLQSSSGSGTYDFTQNGGGTVAVLGNKISDFASSTSSQLAGKISDETGTGSLVFGTSPSLTTPKLTGSTNPVTIASAQTVTGKTITFPNVSANANVITSLGYGTSLPSSPADGDEYYYSTSGYVWHLRYTTGLNKWQFVGGSALIATENNTSTLTSTTYVYDITTADGPSITVPTGMTGTYKIEFGMDVSNTNAGKVNYMGLFTSATGNTSPLGSNTELIVANADNNTGANPATYTASKIVHNVSLTATNTIYAQFKTSANTATVSNRYISITPVTIG